MRLLALADLHLDGNSNKPMDVFGNNWANHEERIFDSWQSVVGTDDCVLIPGDYCWAMQLSDAVPELNKLSSLNGTKVIVRGNHDFWWTSPTRIRAVLPKRVHIIQNDSVDMKQFCICGTRGWLMPGTAGFDNSDMRIFNREIIRLRLSLSSACSRPIVVAMHYPPVGESGCPTEFSNLIDEFKAENVVYGHLHGKSCMSAFNGYINGVKYDLCSADYLEFSPKFIREF